MIEFFEDKETSKIKKEIESLNTEKSVENAMIVTEITTMVAMQDSKIDKAIVELTTMMTNAMMSN